MARCSRRCSCSWSCATSSGENVLPTSVRRKRSPASSSLKSGGTAYVTSWPRSTSALAIGTYGVTSPQKPAEVNTIRATAANPTVRHEAQLPSWHAPDVHGRGRRLSREHPGVPGREAACRLGRDRLAPGGGGSRLHRGVAAHDARERTARGVVAEGERRGRVDRARAGDPGGGV